MSTRKAQNPVSSCQVASWMKKRQKDFRSIQVRAVDAGYVNHTLTPDLQGLGSPVRPLRQAQDRLQSPGRLLPASGWLARLNSGGNPQGKLIIKRVNV
jgi:hypothetical protein